jgi:hypothetical protein
MSKNNEVYPVYRSYCLGRTWLPLLGLVLAFAAPCARAVPLPTGDTALSGTTLAQRPELAGEVVEDQLIPYSFQGAGSSVSGVIKNRVVRSVDGTLKFYWRIIPDASSTGDIIAFRVGGFGGFTLDGDFHLDSPGSVGPDTARNFGDGSVNFLFSDGVSAGESSFFFFLDTQATTYSNTGSYDLLSCSDNGCISPLFTTFAPAETVGLDIHREPQGTAPNLIVLVHGCCTDGNDVNTLREKFREAYAGRAILQSGEWEIVVWDWTKCTPDPNVECTPKHDYIAEAILRGIPAAIALFLEDANKAYDNAVSRGLDLARAIEDYPTTYKHIHFIGHSAGANLINWAAKALAGYKIQGNEERPFIHLTFLDAYTPNEDESEFGLLEGYPEHYSEHYIHYGLKYTDTYLRHAFNFDITGWGHSINEDGAFGHHWPLNWYIKSIKSPKFKLKGKFPYGYPLSREGGNDQFTNVMGQLYPPGDSIKLATYPPSAGVPVVTKVDFPSSIPADGVPVVGTVEFKDSNAGIIGAKFGELGDTCEGCGVPFEIDPGVSDLTEGKFNFSMSCSGDPFFWAVKLILTDRQDHPPPNESSPYTFSIACELPLAR